MKTCKPIYNNFLTNQYKWANEPCVFERLKYSIGEIWYFGKRRSATWGWIIHKQNYSQIIHQLYIYLNDKRDKSRGEKLIPFTFKNQKLPIFSVFLFSLILNKSFLTLIFPCQNFVISPQNINFFLMHNWEKGTWYSRSHHSLLGYTSFLKTLAFNLTPTGTLAGFLCHHPKSLWIEFASFKIRDF